MSVQFDKDSIKAIGSSNAGAFKVAPRVDFDTGTTIRPGYSRAWNSEGSGSAWSVEVSQSLGSSGWTGHVGANTGGGYSIGISGRW